MLPFPQLALLHSQEVGHARGWGHGISFCDRSKIIPWLKPKNDFRPAAKDSRAGESAFRRCLRGRSRGRGQNGLPSTRSWTECSSIHEVVDRIDFHTRGRGQNRILSTRSWSESDPMHEVVDGSGFCPRPRGWMSLLPTTSWIGIHSVHDLVDRNPFCP